MSRKPPRMAASILFGLRKNNLKPQIVEEYLDIDVSFLERYNPSYVENTIPEYLRQGLLEKLKFYNIDPMTEKDIKKMMALNLHEIKELSVLKKYYFKFRRAIDKRHS